MTHRCDLLIERYGTIVPIDSTKADKLRNASMNLKLRICDGLPVSCGIDKLLIGSIGSAYNDLKLLQSYGVTHVVNCSTKIHNKYEENLKYFRFSIEDGSVNLFQEFKGTTVWDSITEATDMEEANITECLDFILNAIHIDNGTVLVHCYQGVSRSVTVIIAYLMKYHQMSYDASLDLIRLTRPNAKPNLYFERQLRAFYVHLYPK